jgi:hypothetical protein
VNERQRDLFLYQWSRRRRPGRARRLMTSAGVGGLGGVVFAWVLYDAGARTPGVHAYDTAGQIGSLVQLLLLAVPVFAGIGLVTADRVWRSHEGMYQRLLASGAQVPDRKPDLTIGDRGPAIAVAIAVVVIAGLIAALFRAASTGRL